MIIWTVLGLYLLLILTLKIPTVQEYFGEKLAHVLGEKLGTIVSIESVDIGIPNSVKLYNIVIRDQKGHDMLLARRLSARIDLLPLMTGKVSIPTAQLFNANILLYQRDSISKPNFLFVLDSLASKDTTSTTPLDLRINSFILRNSSVTFNRYDLPETPHVLNPNHLAFSDISAHIILKALTDDSVNVNIKRLSFKEQSGLKIDRLSLKYIGNQEHSRLQDFTLNMPHTNIQLGDFEASYRMRDGKLIIPSLFYRGSIRSSSITLSDLECLLPSLKNFNSTIFITSSIEGKGEKLVIPDLVVTSTTGDIDINIDGWIENLTKTNPEWQANINNLKLSDKTVNFISQNMKGQRAQIPDIVSRLGKVDLVGIANGEGISAMNIRSQLNTDVGNVSLQFEIDKQSAFKGSIDTRGIHLNRLLGDNQFGLLATKGVCLQKAIPSLTPMVSSTSLTITTTIIAISTSTARIVHPT